MKNFNISKKKNLNLDADEFLVTFDGEKKQQKKKNTSIYIKLVTGAIIGFVNGFWGGGGGMICVPLLMQVIGLPEKKSHATTLLIMLPLCLTSLVVYMFRSSLPLGDSLKIGGGFVVGGILGALLLKVISNAWLGIVFSLIIIAGGIKMLI